MKSWIQYIKTPQRAFAFLFLLLFPIHTVFIYSEQYINGYKWEYGTLAYYGIELLGWIFVLSLLPLLMTRVRQTRFRVSSDRMLLGAVLLLLVYSFVSTLWAIDTTLAQQQTTLVILMCLLILQLPSVLSLREMVGAISIGALLPLGIGLYQFFAQDLFASVWLGMSGPDVADGGVSVIQFGDERWLRAYGTFAHPNIFGGYLAIIAMAILLRLQEKTREWVQAGYMGMLVLIGTILVFTMSRSAWLALATGVTVLMMYILQRLSLDARFRVQKGLVVLGIGILFGASIAWPLVSSRIFGGSAHEYASQHERLALQDIAFNLFWQHPIVGVGPGNMTAALIAYDDTKAGYAYQPVHSVPLLLFVEYGIIGILLLGLIGYTAVRVILKGHHVHSRIGLLLPLVPLLLLDHYLWTSVHGLGIGTIYLAILLSSTIKSRDYTDRAHIDE
jgi:hypothetical protein